MLDRRELLLAAAMSAGAWVWPSSSRAATVYPLKATRGVRLELTTTNGIEVFPVRVEGEAAQAAFDLGNGSNVLVAGGYAKRRGLVTDGRPVSQEIGGGLGGAAKRSVFALKSLEIAGNTLTDVPASLDEGDFATELNVGISVLRHFVITTDFRAHSLWLEAAG
jgi:hypothetical protein